MVSLISQYYVGIFLIILALVLSKEYDASTNKKKTTKMIKSRHLRTLKGDKCRAPNCKFQPHGETSYSYGYRDCKDELGQCSLCGIGNRGIGKSCTSHFDCTSELCKNENKTACNGKCEDKIQDGLPAFYSDYKDCKSGVGRCNICGIGIFQNGHVCNDDDNCISRKCDGATGNNCNGICITPIGYLDEGLLSHECSILGGAEEYFPQLPFGCQYYVDPGYTEYNKYIFNTANKDDLPFSNAHYKTNDKCKDGWCLRSYSVMQTRVHNYGPNGMLSEGDCAKLPEAYPDSTNFFSFKVHSTELPYGCQHFYWNESFHYVVYNTANKDVKPFENVAGETNEHCKSGFCVDSYSIMQVWGAVSKS